MESILGGEQSWWRAIFGENNHHKLTRLFTKLATALARFSHRVAMSVCLCVCPCHRKTPTSQCCGELWSNNIFLILASNHTVKKKSAFFFLPSFLKCPVSVPTPPKTPTSWYFLGISSLSSSSSPSPQSATWLILPTGCCLADPAKI